MTALTSPILTVTLEDPDGETREYTVQTDNRNQVHYDMNRHRKGYPAQRDAPTLWITYLAWHALATSGTIPADQSFEAFNGRCLDVFSSDAEGNRLTREQIEAQAPANPTQPDHAPA